jgi:hypothetical protein
VAEDCLVGYRESGPERDIVMMKYAGRCYSCNCRVYIVPSGFDIMRRDDCDPILICNVCDHLHPGAWERVLGNY